MIGQIKSVIKKYVAYTLEDDVKKYQIRNTPICIHYSLRRKYQRKWANLPIQPNKIVIDNYMGSGYGCNSKYVTQQLLKNKDKYDIVWIVRDIEKQKSEFPEGIRLVRYKSKEAFEEYATARVWLSNYHMVAYLNKGLFKKEGQTYIQMWHGSFGIKKIEGDCSLLNKDENWMYLARKNSECTDYWISNSRFETEVYKSAFWKVRQIEEYGHPRNDILQNISNEMRRQIQSKLGLEKNQKCVLYVPTFRDNDTIEGFTLDYDELLESLKERFESEWILLMRMHPRMSALAEKTVPKQANIRNVTDYPDIQELLVAADAMITDYSSCIFDYILTGRPGFIYATDADNYEKQRGLYYPLQETPFAIASTMEELKQNIRTFQEQVYKERVASFLQEKGSLEDGKAAQRVTELVNELIEEKKI